MTNTSWDPLQNSAEADTEIISAAQKRQIRNILKSYVGMYDAFSELIQNGMDAVDRRLVEEGDGKYSRKLWLEIDLRENSFSIVDNGVGLKEKEFRSFLAPNISFKSGNETRGSKGVGATYIAYGFDYLQFGTKGNGTEFVGEIKGGRDWVDDEQGIVTRPVVISCETQNEYFKSIDRGSIFKVKFGGKNIRPKDLSWYSATTPEQWLYLLLIKTPLGAISYHDEKTSYIQFSLTVVDKLGESRTLTDIDAAYIFPHNKINASVDLKEVLKTQKALIEKGKDASALPSRFYKSNGVYEFFSTDELISLRNEEEVMLKQYQVEAYGYFVYSTSVWDQLNDDVAKLRKGYRVLKGGLQLANNRMMQGDLIVIPLTSNTGYQNQSHVIVHFRGAEPDLGRKGFQPELKEAAERIAVSIVGRLKKWRSLLKTDSGAKPNIVKEMEIHEWIKQQEKHEETSPLQITNKNFFAPINEISITSTPQSEQDVVVLFNQLVAGGVIRGIKLLATSQIKRYDGLYKFVVKEPLVNHIFDKQKNPLGVEELKFSSEIVSAPKILEYKYCLDGLIAEFENNEKNERDVHLAIVWEMGESWQHNYEVTSLLDLDNLHQRDFHGITHILKSGNHAFDVIVLRELIDYLNDVDGCQEYQKEKYCND